MLDKLFDQVTQMAFPDDDKVIETRISYRFYEPFRVRVAVRTLCFVHEVEGIRQLATSDDFRHMPTSTLSRCAQRTGKVYASASTWLRLIRERGWRRSRTRVHLAKPKVRIRASNEIWHIDVTVIRLLNRTKLYLHGVVDNFSRRLLAWKLVEKLSPTTTCEVLAEVAKHLSEVQSPVT